MLYHPNSIGLELGLVCKKRPSLTVHSHHRPWLGEGVFQTGDRSGTFFIYSRLQFPPLPFFFPSNYSVFITRPPHSATSETQYGGPEGTRFSPNEEALQHE